MDINNWIFGVEEMVRKKIGKFNYIRFINKQKMANQCECECVWLRIKRKLWKIFKDATKVAWVSILFYATQTIAINTCKILSDRLHVIYIVVCVDRFPIYLDAFCFNFILLLVVLLGPLNLRGFNLELCAFHTKLKGYFVCNCIRWR